MTMYRKELNEEDWKKPKQTKDKDNLVAFTPPGKHFTAAGREFFNCLFFFMQACNDRGVAPVCWNWQYILMQMLEMMGGSDFEKRCLANLICLILSSASTDKSCIQSTKNLKDNGYLDIDKLANADVDVIAGLIQGGGIHNEKAQWLIDLAKHLKNNCDYRVPRTYDGLIAIKGVNRKTALLMLTEVFGELCGIPSDSHIQHAIYAYWLFDETKGCSKVGADYAEAALREWIPQHRLPQTNKVFGSFAQLFTQDLTNVSTDEQQKTADGAMDAILDYLSGKKQVEMIWTAIFLVRKHYKMVKENKEAAEKAARAKAQKEKENSKEGEGAESI